jgi:ABC-type methionine transport system ATPase subunit
MTFSAYRTASNNAIASGLAVPRLTEIHRVRQRIQIQIPPKYTQEPVISTLITRYELDVNIISALLATNSRESGWFELELYGIPDRIQNALTYLSQLYIEILNDDAATQKSWAFH